MKIVRKSPKLQGLATRKQIEIWQAKQQRQKNIFWASFINQFLLLILVFFCLGISYFFYLRYSVIEAEITELGEIDKTIVGWSATNNGIELFDEKGFIWTLQDSKLTRTKEPIVKGLKDENFFYIKNSNSEFILGAYSSNKTVFYKFKENSNATIIKEFNSDFHFVRAGNTTVTNGNSIVEDVTKDTFKTVGKKIINGTDRLGLHILWTSASLLIKNDTSDWVEVTSGNTAENKKVFILSGADFVSIEEQELFHWRSKDNEWLREKLELPETCLPQGAFYPKLTQKSLTVICKNALNGNLTLLESESRKIRLLPIEADISDLWTLNNIYLLTKNGIIYKLENTYAN